VTIVTVEGCLRTHRPVTVDVPGAARAAVAIVLREADSGAEFVVIHRSHRRNDPWSGHMALPGGRQDPGDRDLFHTAVRETREEVGIDLDQHGRRLGHLDDLCAVGRGRPLDLIITPFVCAVTAPVKLVPNQDEVQSAFWIPLGSLRHDEVRGTFRHGHGEQEITHPAFVYRGYTIWGLTHRILNGLLDLLS